MGGEALKAVALAGGFPSDRAGWFSPHHHPSMACKDLSSLTRDQTCASSRGSVASQPLDCQGSLLGKLTLLLKQNPPEAATVRAQNDLANGEQTEWAFDVQAEGYSNPLQCSSPWTEEPGRFQSIGSQSRTRLKRPSTRHTGGLDIGGHVDAGSPESGVSRMLPQFQEERASLGAQVL